MEFVYEKQAIGGISPVTSLLGDRHAPLVWSGSEDGAVTSFLADAEPLARYTRVPAHAGPVRGLLDVQEGIVSAGGDAVRYAKRRGVSHWTLYQKDWRPSAVASSHIHSLDIWVGGTDLNSVHLRSGKKTRTVSVESPIVHLKASRVLVCGTESGGLEIRDGKSLQLIQSLQGHAGVISDMDVIGNTVATCGGSMRNGAFVRDPFVKLFDLRMMKSLPPIPFNAGPDTLRLHPKTPSRLYSCSHTGQLQIYDMSKRQYEYFEQLSSHGFITAMALSSSGDLLMLGDSMGSVSIKYAADDATMNPNTLPVEYRDFPSSLPDVQISENDPLSLVGLAHYKDPLLSVWPNNLTFNVGKPTPKIPPEILANMKMMDFVGYAPNPKTIKRNQILSISYKQSSVGPKFRSEKDRERVFGKGKEETTNSASTHDLHSIVPKCYTKVNIKYSKFGVEDFDFSFYNQTEYGGLENHIRNEYCNSILQVLFYIPTFRQLCKAHLCTPCPSPVCLTCELGFLFRMLEDAKGLNCQASNFLKAFSNIPQANALGLFEPERPTETVAYGKLIQGFNRFILEQLYREITKNDKEKVAALEQLFGFQMRSVTRCQCSHEQGRDICPFVVDLIYSKPVLIGTNVSPPKTPKITFASVLEMSLNKESYSKAWCPGCKKYERMTQNRQVKAAPKILNLNANIQSQDDLELWIKDSSWLPERIGIRFEGGLSVEECDDSTIFSQNTVYYELKSVITEIHQDRGNVRGVVAHVGGLENEGSNWVLFNDFLIESMPRGQALEFKDWKTPSVIQYMRVDDEDFNIEYRLDKSLLVNQKLLNRRQDLLIKYQSLSASEVPSSPGYLVALDAEFVALVKEELEVHSDGTKSVVRPSRLGLARVSCIRGQGPLEGTPFIDDYIVSDEPVVDYLTEYSGVTANDLDYIHSRRPLVSLKNAYKKLRTLVDLGCVLVGHGLKKDFRIINILVPLNKVIDTVDIYFIPSKQRRLSLRFLSWIVLGEIIQDDSHDSIQDALTALKLYKHYLKLEGEGRFDDELERIYEEGRRLGFKPPA